MTFVSRVPILSFHSCSHPLVLSIRVFLVRRFLLAGLFVTALVCWHPGEAWAQDEPEAPAEDTLALGVWDLGLTGRLSGSQAAYRNWTEGGLNTLAVTASASGRARHRSTHWKQVYELRLGFGLIRQDTLDVRKAEDLILLSAALLYLGDGFFETFHPTLAAEARTQFATGYNYDEVPEELTGRALPVKVSDFLSPGTFRQSVGLTYAPAPWFSQRLGLALKETAVLIERLRPLYGVALDTPVRFEAGLESVTNVEREVFTNVLLQSTLSLFAAFNQVDHPDLIWQNIVTMQVNKWLGVNFEFTTLYDRDISRALQLKEVLSVGVTVVLI